MKSWKKVLMLSDEEIAMVGSAETTARPLDGEEYLDLAALNQGVQNQPATPIFSRRILLRRSIHKDIWNKVLKQLPDSRTTGQRWPAGSCEDKRSDPLEAYTDGRPTGQPRGQGAKEGKG